MAKKEPEQSVGGYDHEFIGEISNRFICQICTKVMREPYIAACCGEHYCESCLKKSFDLPRKESCPHCRAEGEEFKYVINKRLRSEINELKVKCSNHGKGCEWTGELGALKTHLESDNGCKFVIISCPYKCQFRFERILRDKHESECLLRPYRCEYCDLSDTYQGITVHHSTCPVYPLTCPNKCGASNIKRKDLADHRNKCPLELIRCTFAEAGCTCRMRRHQLDNHVMSNLQEHLLLMMKAYQQMKRSLQSTEAKLEISEAKLTTAVQLLSQGAEGVKETVYSIIACSPALKTCGDKVAVLMPKISEYYPNSSGKIWYSPPFYYKEGYKMCLVVSGMKTELSGKYTPVLSVSIKLLQGENDDKLKWPIGHEDSESCPPPKPSRLMESAESEVDDIVALGIKCTYMFFPICQLKQLQASKCQYLSTSVDVPFLLVNDCLPFRIEYCDCYINIEVKCSNREKLKILLHFIAL